MTPEIKRLANKYRMNPARLELALDAVQYEYDRPIHNSTFMHKSQVQEILKPLISQAWKLHNHLEAKRPLIFEKLESGNEGSMLQDITDGLHILAHHHTELLGDSGAETITKEALELRGKLLDLRQYPFLHLALDCWHKDKGSVLGNLLIGLPHLCRTSEKLMAGYKKPSVRDTARNAAMLRIVKAWHDLTNKPATWSSSSGRGRIQSDNPDYPERNYYSDNQYGDFLDFFVRACKLTQISVNPDAAVRNLEELRKRNPNIF